MFELRESIPSQNLSPFGDNRLMVPNLVIARALGSSIFVASRIEWIYEPVVAQNSRFSFHFGSVCSNSSSDVLTAQFPLKLSS